MIAAADFVVQSRDHKTQLIVEAKNKAPASADWAARMRRNLFAHLALPPARFFLLALPERFYLWKDASPELATPPDYEVDTQQVLKPYLEKLKASVSDLSENSFELLVRSWLEDLIRSDLDHRHSSQSETWLIESGLYEAIKDGSIKT